MTKNLPLEIARRTAAGQSSQGIMVRIATLAVAVSAAVMIITLAVVFGFRQELTSAISGMAADVTVTDLRSLRASESLPLTDTPRRREGLGAIDGVAEVSAFAVRGGVLRSAAATAGVMLKGVERAEDLAAFGRMTAEGAMPRFEPARRMDILLPAACAEVLGVGVGGRVELLTLEEDGSPRRDMFKVCGTYHSGIDAGGMYVALTDMRNVRRINGWTADLVSGYALRAAEFGGDERIAAEANEFLYALDEEDVPEGEHLSAVPASDLYSDIFNWLGTHDVNAVVIIVIMLVVALFNMVTALLILVMERTRMIGILKSMGMADGAIRRIFLYRAAAIVGRGLLWGNVAGVALVLVQHTTHLLPLDAAAYMVAYVPVRLSPWWVVALDAGFAATLVALLFAVTAIVARISPTEAVRYE